MKFYFKRKNDLGQSLLEALVAIFIILGAVISTLTLVISSINAGRVSTDKLLASSLAREGLEIVRNIRDSNWLSEASDIVNPTTGFVYKWDDRIIDPGMPVAIPVVDEDPLNGLYGLDFTIIDSNDDCSVDGDCRRIYRSGPLYVQRLNPDLQNSGWQPTKFYRLLYVNSICWDDNENESIVPKNSANDCNTEFGGTFSEVGVRIISEVRWPSPNSNSNVIIEERIYDWRL